MRQPRGNALLVGIGGTGKQSLTRLASHMCGYKCFQIELSRGYDYAAFHEDLKTLYNMAGVERQDTVFLFTDTQVFPLTTTQYCLHCVLLDCCRGIFRGYQQYVKLWRGQSNTQCNILSCVTISGA